MGDGLTDLIPACPDCRRPYSLAIQDWGLFEERYGSIRGLVCSYCYTVHQEPIFIPREEFLWHKMLET